MSEEKRIRFVVVNTGERPRPFVVFDSFRDVLILKTADPEVAAALADQYNREEEAKTAPWWRRWLRALTGFHVEVPETPEEVDEGRPPRRTDEAIPATEQEWQRRLRVINERAEERKQRWSRS